MFQARVNRTDKITAQKTCSPGCTQKNANCRKRKLRRAVWQRATGRKSGSAALNWLTVNKSVCNGNLLYYSLHSTHSKFLQQAIDGQDNQCRFHMWDDMWAKIWKPVDLLAHLMGKWWWPRLPLPTSHWVFLQLLLLSDQCGHLIPWGRSFTHAGKPHSQGQRQ